MANYLDKLLNPVKPYDSIERETRDHVAKGIATEDERKVVIHELEQANWPEELAEKMTRESHQIEHGSDR